jgi:hypothetical protein
LFVPILAASAKAWHNCTSEGTKASAASFVSNGEIGGGIVKSIESAHDPDGELALVDSVGDGAQRYFPLFVDTSDLIELLDALAGLRGVNVGWECSPLCLEGVALFTESMA